jgi:hypothetical protein
MNPVARLDAGDRWRHFAVAACGGAVKSQNEVALYVERLRARRASTQVHAYGGKHWLPKARVRQHKVEFRRSSTSTPKPDNPYRNRLFFFCVTKFHSRSPYYQRTCHAAIRPLAVAGFPATRARAAP